jgi:hypothetical protein
MVFQAPLPQTRNVATPKRYACWSNKPPSCRRHSSRGQRRTIRLQWQETNKMIADGLIGQACFRRLELHRDSWAMIEDLTEWVPLIGRRNETEDELQEMKSLERQAARGRGVHSFERSGICCILWQLGSRMACSWFALAGAHKMST